MTKFTRLFLVGALAALTAVPASAATWKIDTLHSSLTFKIRHLLANTGGHFTSWSGTIEAGDDLTKGSVEITIDAASINTENENRDNHLRSSDFFDVENHPTITFKSTKIEKKGDAYVMHGDFTLLGVTKQIEIPFEFHGTAKDPRGNTKAGFSGKTEFNRKDFGMVWNQGLDQGGVVLGDVVKIDIEINAVQVEQSGR
jgi:polyisoprenoid-binding protein YceI